MKCELFGGIEMAPADPIMGLKEAFDEDERCGKVNLGVGIYKDAGGKTPLLECVKRAELELLEEWRSKAYLKITGMAELAQPVQSLMFGKDHSILGQQLARTAQTPGGTGALRVAADFIHRTMPGARVWLSDPTWANHGNVFHAAGIETQEYSYYDAESKSLDFEGMLKSLGNVPSTDVVLLHACCHNPTGCDPDIEQWGQLAELAADRGFLPLFDFAYQGFGQGLDEDAAGLRRFAESVDEFLVASSFSKNFGLYNERVGALTIVAGNSQIAARSFSQIAKCIRANYSNPPAHGAALVVKVLTSDDLRTIWISEVAEMCQRLNDTRALVVATLAGKGAAMDFGFMQHQKGMFSYTGLRPEHVVALREKHGIYVVNSGRINVAGLNEENVESVCDAIVDVLGR